MNRNEPCRVSRLHPGGETLRHTTVMESLMNAVHGTAMPLMSRNDSYVQMRAAEVITNHQSHRHSIEENHQGSRVAYVQMRAAERSAAEKANEARELRNALTLTRTQEGEPNSRPSRAQV